MIEPKKESRNLECDLTDDEVAEHAVKAASKEEDRGKHEAEELSLKEQAKSSKEAAGVVDREIRSHLKRVRTRKEYRYVDCELAYDPDTEKMVTTRLDTGVIIDSRPLHENERQGELRVLPPERTSTEQDEVDRAPAGA